MGRVTSTKPRPITPREREAEPIEKLAAETHSQTVQHNAVPGPPSSAVIVLVGGRDGCPLPRGAQT